MYKCRNCGHIFDEGEQKTRYEKHNDYYTEPINSCPVCMSDEIENCVYCKCCEDEFFKDELNRQGICKNCVENFIKDNAKDINLCYEIGKKVKVPVEINSFLYEFFFWDIKSIEEYLLEYVKGMQEFAKFDFSKYLKEADEDTISEMILNEKG